MMTISLRSLLLLTLTATASTSWLGGNGVQADSIQHTVPATEQSTPSTVKKQLSTPSFSNKLTQLWTSRSTLPLKQLTATVTPTQLTKLKEWFLPQDKRQARQAVLNALEVTASEKFAKTRDPFWMEVIGEVHRGSSFDSGCFSTIKSAFNVRAYRPVSAPPSQARLLAEIYSYLASIQTFLAPDKLLNGNMELVHKAYCRFKLISLQPEYFRVDLSLGGDGKKAKKLSKQEKQESMTEAPGQSSSLNYENTELRRDVNAASQLLLSTQPTTGARLAMEVKSVRHAVSFYLELVQRCSKAIFGVPLDNELASLIITKGPLEAYREIRSQKSIWPSVFKRRLR